MPMLMKRTPYSVAPYGIDSYPAPSGWFKTYAKEGWIFVYQVRGSASAQWPETHGRARWQTDLPFETCNRLSSRSVHGLRR